VYRCINYVDGYGKSFTVRALLMAITVYGLVGSGIYFVVARQNGTLTSVLGDNIKINIFKKNKKED